MVKLTPNINRLSSKGVKHPWLMAIVLVLLVNAFNSTLMISHHQDSPHTNNSTMMEHQHGEHFAEVDHCGNGASSMCGEAGTNMDCSVSHCSPAGLPVLAIATPADSAAISYLDTHFSYQSLVTALPYIPPIAAHI